MVFAQRNDPFKKKQNLVPQDKDLKDSMTNALINDKPQFVRLFTENGFNIRSYLTYKKLEKLYQSVPSGTLLYQLLERRLLIRHGITALSPAHDSQPDSPNQPKESNQCQPVMKVTLFEVSLFFILCPVHLFK